MSCKKCLEPHGFDNVLCSQCDGRYHYGCAGVQETTYRKMTAEKKANWRCVACRQGDSESSLAEIVRELKGLNARMNTMQNDLTHANLGITSIDSKLSILETRLDKVDSRLTLVEKKTEGLTNLELKNKNMEEQIAALMKADNIRDQFARNKNVEISGIPQHSGENLTQILKEITVTVGFQLRDTDVDSIHRVRRFTSKDDGKQGPPRPPAIVVHFCQRRRKDELLAAVRARRGLSTADAGLPGPATSVYVNDHLTPHHKQLLKKARDLKSELNYTFLWVKDCKILMRKDEQSKIIQIDSEADLKKVK